MSEEAASEWQAFCTAFADYSNSLNRVESVHVNSAALREATKQVAHQYIRRVRPHLHQLDLGDNAEALDTAFQSLLELAEGRNVTSSYKKHAKAVRKALRRVSGQIEYQLAGAVPLQSGPSREDAKIIETLASLVASASVSYQQAIADLGDEKRISFRGPALELREALREVLDHLAPDDSVTQAPGFQLEKGRHGPTMKQKVRFILRARRRSKSESEVPEDMTGTVEAMLGDLTRSVYDRGSVATHVAKERRTVIQLKRYIDVVLQDILEL